MEAPRIRCIVVTADGVSRRVGVAGLLIGRQGDCDIVIADPSVSRRHALIQLTGDGAVAVALGRTALEINGKKCEKVQELAHGDRIAFPGVALQVELEVQRPSASAKGMYRVRLGSGSSFGLVHSPFVLGGDKADEADGARVSAALGCGQTCVSQWSCLLSDPLTTEKKRSCTPRVMAPASPRPILW